VKVSGEANPAYTLTIAAPSSGEPDWAEGVKGNDTQEDATALRTIHGTLTVTDLSLHSAADQDWYRFELDRPPAPGNEVRIDFDSGLGEIQAVLLDPTDVEHIFTRGNGMLRISMKGCDRGTYFVRLHGSALLTYQLTIGGNPQPDVDWAEYQGGDENNDSPSGPLISAQRPTFKKNPAILSLTPFFRRVI